MGILDLAVQSDQSRAFAACMDGVYAIEFTAKPEENEAKPQVVRIGKHDSFVSGVALLEEHAELISTSFDGTFHVRRLTDIHADVQPHIAERIHSFWSWDMALSPNHALVASVTGQYLPGSEEYSPAHPRSQQSRYSKLALGNSCTSSPCCHRFNVWRLTRVRASFLRPI